MKWVTVLAMSAVFASVPAYAQVAQIQLDSILRKMSPAEIAMRRSACAMGSAPKLTADSRAAGIDRADTSAWCVTVLTRAGRDGTLGYVRDPRVGQATPAISFDSGFVSGFRNHEPVPEGGPTMLTLLPIADRCLDQREANIKLCGSVGYMLGVRAARGEVVIDR